jgi:hypothetical protein
LLFFKQFAPIIDVRLLIRHNYTGFKAKKNGNRILPAGRFRRRTDEEIIRLPLCIAISLPNELQKIKIKEIESISFKFNQLKFNSKIENRCQCKLRDSFAGNSVHNF